MCWNICKTFDAELPDSNIDMHNRKLPAGILVPGMFGLTFPNCVLPVAPLVGTGGSYHCHGTNLLCLNKWIISFARVINFKQEQ